MTVDWGNSVPVPKFGFNDRVHCPGQRRIGTVYGLEWRCLDNSVTSQSGWWCRVRWDGGKKNLVSVHENDLESLR